MPDNWQSVELKHLRALRSIAETGTFWAASEQLNSSLSTVSDHVTALEALVGQRLIERSRGRRTVELTEAGRLLLGHADAIESRLRAAEADFRAYVAGRSGSLRIGIYQSVANKVLPEVLRRFRQGWPDVEVVVTEADHDADLVDMVERGAVDVSFAIQPIREGPFEVRELMRDPYVVVAAAGSQLARRRPRVADLADRPMVAFQHGKHQDMAESFLLARGIRPRVVFRSNDNGTVQAMVAAGVGVALSPLLAVDETDKKVHLAQLAEPVPPRVLVVLWHRDRYTQPALAAFVDTAMAVAAEIERAHDAFLRRRAS
ncbi:MAG: LysR family transcriptional regulator [Chloroflexi bacterium]|nr:MAG: LysR family transcriptional regulator [Chloroflexota bacterium]